MTLPPTRANEAERSANGEGSAGGTPWTNAICSPCSEAASSPSTAGYCPTRHGGSVTHHGTPAARALGHPLAQGRDARARSDPLLDQPVGDQLAVAVDDRAAVDPQPVGQGALGRQPGPFGQGPGQDLLAQPLVELAVDRDDALAVDGERVRSPAVRRHDRSNSKGCTSPIPRPDRSESGKLDGLFTRLDGTVVFRACYCMENCRHTQRSGCVDRSATERSGVQPRTTPMLDVSTPALATNGPPAPEPDPRETDEWIEALDGVISAEGPQRAREIIEALTVRARTRGADIPITLTTPYVNTIPVDAAAAVPGRPEHRAALARLRRAGTRWRWWCAPTRTPRRARRPHRELRLGGDAVRRRLQPLLARRRPRATAATCVYFQGHSAPGIYARAFLEGRLTEEQLRQLPPGGRRQGALARIRIPWLMPDFWQFPTVSMGLGPLHGDLPGALHAVPARPRHRRHRAAARSGPSSATARWTSPSRWARIGMAAREKLDNLIFVVNCNLQRLDGPVRGNGKIIQELEAHFRGAGWNVHQGDLGPATGTRCSRATRTALLRAADGRDASTASTRPSRPSDGAYVREHFFGKYPETARAGRRHDRRRHLAT